MISRTQLNFLLGLKQPARIFLSPFIRSVFGAAKSYSSGVDSLKQRDKISQTLKTKFPLAKCIEVVDVSGGCGSMYEIYVESEEFKGLSLVKQHKLINEILKEDIKLMHGLRIHTKIPHETKQPA